MLNVFLCSDGQLRRPSGAISADGLRNAVWIDLVSATPDLVAQVEQATGLQVPSEANINEIETSSRLAMRDGVLYLSMPLVSVSGDRPRNASVGFILSPERLITVRFAASRTFDAYAMQPPRGQDHQAASAHIFVGLMEAIVDRQADVLEQVRNDLDTISHAIFAMGTTQVSGRKNEDATLRRILGELGRIGDMISHIRDTQVGAARIVPYVQAMTKAWLPKELSPRLKTLRQDIVSVSDFDTYLNEKLQFLLDATLGFINIAQNNVMKVMAIASVVGIPPVLIAGIYGMNFKSIPELDWAYGYAWGWGLIIITTLIPLAVFRWRKWI
jgi:magnesium transporter